MIDGPLAASGPRADARPGTHALAELLFPRGTPPTPEETGFSGVGATPPVVDLTAAALTLARGERGKVLLALPEMPLEWALVRRPEGAGGDALEVSLYATGALPDPVFLDRRVSLGALLSACADALLEGASGEAAHPEGSAQGAGGEARRRLAERARAAVAQHRASLASKGIGGERPGGVDRPRRYRVGGPGPWRSGHPAPSVPSPSEPPEVAGASAPALSLVADVWIRPEPRSNQNGTAERSDAHALLFRGRLWAVLRGRSLPLIDAAPVMPALLRCVAVVRRLVDAWEAERPVTLRLRGQRFLVGARRERNGQVSLTLGTQTSSPVTITGLDLPELARPILRTTADAVRALVSVDRRQSRNLRVRALRRELRELRRRVRRRAERSAFVNADPDRLRASAPPPEPVAGSVEGGPAGIDAASPDGGGASPRRGAQGARPPQPAAEGDPALRFSERYRVELEALDASSTFACGAVLVAATPDRSLAVDRDSGGLVWVREGLGGTTLMAGRTLVHLGSDGRVELCDVRDGEAFARASVADLAGRVPGRAETVFDPDLPPTLVLAVEQRLLGLDLRTGEVRWRVGLGAEGVPLDVARRGRVLLAVCGVGAVHAVDTATGEVVWRAAGPQPYAGRPAVVGDRALVASPGREARLDALDLYSGRLLWRLPLDDAEPGAPIPFGPRAVLPVRRAGAGPAGRGELRVLDLRRGEAVASIDDPGVGRGGAATLEIDGRLVANLPGGRVVGLHPAGPRESWSRRLADPLEDELPRRLEPVLRNGALFVPAGGVHLLRPTDGSALGDRLPTDLVPDFLRVDERGWVYVGEESGTLAAYAPVPRLRLVR
jgi:outer membrane protein assembly factor BamB